MVMHFLPPSCIGFEFSLKVLKVFNQYVVSPFEYELFSVDWRFLNLGSWPLGFGFLDCIRWSKPSNKWFPSFDGHVSTHSPITISQPHAFPHWMITISLFFYFTIYWRPTVSGWCFQKKAPMFLWIPTVLNITALQDQNYPFFPIPWLS